MALKASALPRTGVKAEQSKKNCVIIPRLVFTERVEYSMREFKFLVINSCIFLWLCHNSKLVPQNQEVTFGKEKDG